MSDSTDGAVVDPLDDELVDAFLRASRVLVGLSARTIEQASSPVTLAQFRALVVIRTGAVGNQSQLASELGVAASSVTRMVERLETAGLVTRARTGGGTRGFTLALTDEGDRVVDVVTAARRAGIVEVVGRMPRERRADLVAALESFSDANGEPPVEALGEARE